MAFNFNWSPLAADEGFYQRARDLLTRALNKTPKPPIIVDDIIVTEFNLGSVPPELEILEIGDLAEDRFRGIFKMCYSGDAFLTLKTKVQANPMNTYLSSKPTFTSPNPLAAASGLTIPLSITLSEIKLSAFIILVFSKQKGLTLVFRNDPLESLKVSSTFDSIQFVRDYLQRTIEGKLRDLMMDELPAIIHRLSLQLLFPDQIPKEDEEAPKEQSEEVVDALGNPVESSELSFTSLGGDNEISPFSQNNLFRWAFLCEAHKTLSLYTPGIQNAVFRAWAAPRERTEAGHTTPFTTTWTRSSYHGSATTYTFSDTSSDYGHVPSRPSLVSLNSATMDLALGSGRHPKSGRKKKTRVVNLRRKEVPETISERDETEATIPDSVLSEALATTSAPLPSVDVEPDENLDLFATPEVRHATPVGSPRMSTPLTSPPKVPKPAEPLAPEPASVLTQSEKSAHPPLEPISHFNAASQAAVASIKSPFGPGYWRTSGSQSESSGIYEQAWIMKMAGEIARRVYEEKNENPAFWDDRELVPPPAYEQ